MSYFDVFLVHKITCDHVCGLTNGVSAFLCLRGLCIIVYFFVTIVIEGLRQIDRQQVVSRHFKINLILIWKVEECWIVMTVLLKHRHIINIDLKIKVLLEVPSKNTEFPLINLSFHFLTWTWSGYLCASSAHDYYYNCYYHHIMWVIWPCVMQKSCSFQFWRCSYIQREFYLDHQKTLAIYCMFKHN